MINERAARSLPRHEVKSRSGERRSTKEKRGHITAEAVRQAQGRNEKFRVAREILSSCAGVLTSAPHLQRPGSRRVVGDGPTITDEICDRIPRLVDRRVSSAQLREALDAALSDAERKEILAQALVHQALPSGTLRSSASPSSPPMRTEAESGPGSSRQ